MERDAFMGHIPIEDILPKANGSIYGLIRLASVRALELADGKPVLGEKISSEKTATTAMREIAEGNVVSKGAEDLLVKKVDETEKPEDEDL